jgi:hypothetical protein
MHVHYFRQVSLVAMNAELTATFNCAKCLTSLCWFLPWLNIFSFFLNWHIPHGVSFLQSKPVIHRSLASHNSHDCMNSFLWVWTLNVLAKYSFLEGLGCENLVVKSCTHWKSKILSPEDKIWTSRTFPHYPVSFTILVVCSNDSSCLSYTKHNCLLCLCCCFVSFFDLLVMSVRKT